MEPGFGGKPWSLVHHVCVASAVRRIRPDRVFLYFQYEPSGPWWDLTKPLLTPVRIQAPAEVFGRPLLHPAHQADVVRLEKLLEVGGIYLDADVLVQRSFDGLLDHSTVLGQEGVGAQEGLANAVILAEPGAPFVRRWYEEYRTFRGRGHAEYWKEHSVEVPARLAKAYPGEVTVLPHEAFYWPLWTAAHLRWIFESSRPIDLEHTYANHLWESLAWSEYLRDLTPRRVRSVDSNFHLWARPLLEGVPDDYGRGPLGDRLQTSAKRIAKGVLAAVRGAKAAGGHPQRSGSDVERPPGSASRREVFETVYRDKLWGADGGSPDFFSGAGSRGALAERYVSEMAKLLRAHQEEAGRPLTVVDIGCGDFHVGHALVRAVDGITYVGCDIVPAVVERNSARYASDRVSFRALDIVTDTPPKGDICLVRQVLQHLSNSDIAAALSHLEAFDTVYVTEHQPVQMSGPPNPDKTAGADVRFDWELGVGRGVELGESPYSRQTETVFTSFAPPVTLLVTERVSLRRSAQTTGLPSRGGP